jgi:hypothetical protein
MQALMHDSWTAIRQLGEANYNIWWPDDDHDEDGIVCNVHEMSAKSVTFSAVVYDRSVTSY